MQNFKKLQPFYFPERKASNWFERAKYEELCRNESPQNDLTSQQSSLGQSSNRSRILSSDYRPDSHVHDESMSNENTRRFNNNYPSSRSQFSNSYGELDESKSENWCSYENSNASLNYPSDFQRADTSTYENRLHNRDYSDDFAPSNQFDDDLVFHRNNNKFQSAGRSFDHSSPNPNVAKARSQQLEEKFLPNSRQNPPYFRRPYPNQAAQNFQRQYQTKNSQRSGANEKFLRRKSGYPNQYGIAASGKRKPNNYQPTMNDQQTMNLDSRPSIVEMDVNEDQAESTPPTKRFKREYQMKTNFTKQTRNQSTRNQSVQTKKVLSTLAPTKPHCVPCSKHFASDELLKEHKELEPHLSMLKSYVKKNLASLYEYSKELDGLISSQEEVTNPAVCGLCDTYNLNTKTHKWSMIHLLRQLAGPGVPLNKQVDPKDFENEDKDNQTNSPTELTGLEYVFPFAGHYCKLCRKICQTKSSHCLSKKHIHLFERAKNRKNSKNQKENDEIKKEDETMDDLKEEDVDENVDENVDKNVDKKVDESVA